MRLAWTIFYSLLLINIITFSAVLLSLKPFWLDIDDVIFELSGISVPWTALVLALTLIAFLFILYLLGSGIAAIKKNAPIMSFNGANIIAITIFIIWNLLLTILVMEVGDLIFAWPKTGYSLPDPLVGADGGRVTDSETWMTERRPEILSFFETQVYGSGPDQMITMSSEVKTVRFDALNGTAIRKEVSLSFTENQNKLNLDLLIYIPRDGKKSAPLFLGLNFRGNHSIVDDPDIKLSEQWMENSRKHGIQNHRATESSRGLSAVRWPVQKIIQRGYGLATVYYGDIDPDFNDGFKNGPHPLFYRAGQVGPDPDQWGSIGAWAWGLSRVMDYLSQESEIDSRRIILLGHSRLGKAALWAGALDDRFAMIISNNSGCMGAALSRRKFGETIKIINRDYPHWFCENFKQYNDRENEMPVDQHMLIALMAPRPVYIASAELDAWSDPNGEFISARSAGPVYGLFGRKGLPVETMPDLNRPVMGDIGYHIRSGKHDVTSWDWEQFMDFSDHHLGRP